MGSNHSRPAGVLTTHDTEECSTGLNESSNKSDTIKNKSVTYPPAMDATHPTYKIAEVLMRGLRKLYGLYEENPYDTKKRVIVTVEQFEDDAPTKYILKNKFKKDKMTMNLVAFHPTLFKEIREMFNLENAFDEFVFRQKVGDFKARVSPYQRTSNCHFFYSKQRKFLIKTIRVC
mmetsp:Transcript_18519/g.25761  ORF Transcript_18519/g.25761 Transcript_18519/m.25761 type:complete len:175 (+) Transcript_18519:59-583(+)